MLNSYTKDLCNNKVVFLDRLMWFSPLILKDGEDLIALMDI